MLVFDVTLRSFQQMLRDRAANELCMCYRKIVRRAAKQGIKVTDREFPRVIPLNINAWKLLLIVVFILLYFFVYYFFLLLDVFFYALRPHPEGQPELCL